MHVFHDAAAVPTATTAPPHRAGWIFSLPFVIAEDLGWFLPPVMFLVSAAFFGLDQARSPPPPHALSAHPRIQRVPPSLLYPSRDELACMSNSRTA